MGLGAMNAEYAHAAGYTGKNAVIGVLDSGYYDKHPELAPSRFSPILAAGIPGVLNARNDTHGTRVSGVIGASRDGLGMHGVAPDARVLVANTNASDGFLFGVADPKYPASDAKYLRGVWRAGKKRRAHHQQQLGLAAAVRKVRYLGECDRCLPPA